MPRNRTVRSCEGYCLFLLSILNFIPAFIYNGRHKDFRAAVVAANSACEVPGAEIVKYYTTFAVIPFVVLAVALYVLSFIFKLVGLLCFLLCPDWHLRTTKRHHGIPPNFDHLYDELHTESDDQPKPVQADTTRKVADDRLIPSKESAEVNEADKKIE